MNVKSFGDVFSLTMAGGWRQLLHFTYALNYYLGGLNTFGYHLLNEVLHAVNVLLVYGIILAAIGEDQRARYAALAGSAVYAVHTLFSSAVSYIAGRSSVLCAMFYFAAIFFFFKALNSERRETRWMFFTATIVAGWFAWVTKQEAITLPIFLAAVVFLRSEKKNWRWIAALAVIPLILLAVIWDQIKTLYAVTTANKILISAGFGTVLPPATFFRTYVTSVVAYFFPRFVLPLATVITPNLPEAERFVKRENRAGWEA